MKNIHFNDLPEAAPKRKPDKLKTRKITASPLEEYAHRGGEAAPIPDALAALILAPSGRPRVTARGVTIEKGGQRRTYWHPDSPLCSDLSNDGRRVVYSLGKGGAVAHLLTEEGKYLETLPAKDRPSPLDAAAMKKAHASHQRSIGRAAATLQKLHEADSGEAVHRAEQNAEEARHLCSAAYSADLPEEPRRPSAPAPLARRIAAVNVEVERGEAALEERGEASEEARAVFAEEAEAADLPEFEDFDAPAVPWDVD